MQQLAAQVCEHMWQKQVKILGLHYRPPGFLIIKLTTLPPVRLWLTDYEWQCPVTLPNCDICCRELRNHISDGTATRRSRAIWPLLCETTEILSLIILRNWNPEAGCDHNKTIKYTHQGTYWAVAARKWLSEDTKMVVLFCKATKSLAAVSLLPQQADHVPTILKTGLVCVGCHWLHMATCCQKDKLGEVLASLQK